MKNFFSKYHKGEKLAQQKAGEQQQAVFNSQAISNEIIDGALTFISEQEYVITSFVDSAGRVWSSILIGDKGFIYAENKKTLKINLSKIMRHGDDPFWDFLESNTRKTKTIGFVIIELASRRRIRVNGIISQQDDNEIGIHINEAYPNCMKYIQRRHITQRNSNNFSTSSKTGEAILETQLAIIEKADTFFIGTNNPKGDLDVSHRGGSPGFIEIIDNKTLRVPDYKGNSMFNTFGNLMLDKRAGLVFWDFDKGILLQMTGHAEIDWHNEDTDNKTNGTGRFWNFHINNWIQHKIQRDFTWELLDYSKDNPT